MNPYLQWAHDIWIWKLYHEHCRIIMRQELERSAVRMSFMLKRHGLPPISI